MTFGDKLKQLAKEEALTSAEMGDILGVTPSQIRNWYNGKRMPNNMSVDVVYVLCKVFNVDIEYFISDDIDEAVTVAIMTHRYILNKREEEYSDTRRLKY